MEQPTALDVHPPHGRLAVKAGALDERAVLLEVQALREGVRVVRVGLEHTGRVHVDGARWWADGEGEKERQEVEGWHETSVSSEEWLGRGRTRSSASEA